MFYMNGQGILQITLMIADKQQNLKPQQQPSSRIHRVFQKCQCRSVFALIINLVEL